MDGHLPRRRAVTFREDRGAAVSLVGCSTRRPKLNSWYVRPTMKSARGIVLYTLIPLVAVGIIAAVLSALTSVSFWAAFGMGVVAVLANGMLATLEDDLPGGFNNPDGTSTPTYARVIGHLGRWFVVFCCVALAVAATSSAFTRSHHREQLADIGVAALSAGAALFMSRKRRWAVIGAAAGVIALLVAATLGDCRGPRPNSGLQSDGRRQ